MYPRPRILERTADFVRIETTHGRNVMLIVLVVGSWFVHRWLGFGITIAAIVAWTYQVTWVVDRAKGTVTQERRLLEFTVIVHSYPFSTIAALVIRAMPAVIHLGGYTLFLQIEDAEAPLKLLSYAVTKKQLRRAAEMFLPYLPDGLAVRDDTASV